MDVSRLKVATLEDHRLVEDSLPLMQPDLTRDTYIAVLQRLYGIVAAWEELAEERFTGSLQDAAKSRRRLSLLEQDLRFFGVHPESDDRPLFPDFEDACELAGAMYVMEGSRLGGQFIARHVSETLGLGSSGCSFFSGFGVGTGAKWNEFLDVLRTQIDDSCSEKVIIGAKRCLESSARGCEPAPSWSRLSKARPRERSPDKHPAAAGLFSRCCLASRRTTI